MRAGCVCQPEKRHWLAAAAHTCRPATIPPELAKIHVSGPQILNKTGLRIVAGKWAQNLAHTPGCCFKFREGPVFGHEIVAKKGRKIRTAFFNKNQTQNHELGRGLGLPSSARPSVESRQPDAPNHVDNTSGPRMTNFHHDKRIAEQRCRQP